MTNALKMLFSVAALSLAACATIEPGSVSGKSNTNNYTEPTSSGLNAVKPYPNSDDVCVSLNSSSLTKPFEKENHFLIACPKHEIGAIGDRKSEQNAEVVGNAKHWVVMRIRNQ